MKNTASYFYPVDGHPDLSVLEKQHQRQFPGNRLAVLDTLTGKIAKVAFSVGTTRPNGAISFAEGKQRIEEYAASQPGIGMTATKVEGLK